MLAKITAVYSLYGEVASMKWKNEMVKECNGKSTCSAILEDTPLLVVSKTLDKESELS